MAARELERSIREFGLRGAEICSNITGKNLDDKGFAPFYTKLQQLDVPVFIHPSNVLRADRLRPYHLQNLIGNPSVSAVNHPNPSCSSCASWCDWKFVSPTSFLPARRGGDEGGGVVVRAFVVNRIT
jgi:Amidohydrolase